MPAWFDTNIDERFEAFSNSHIVLLLLFISGIVGLFLSYRILLSYQLLQQLVRWGLFSILLMAEITHTLWGIANGSWSMEDHAPLHLCGLGSILSMIALVTYNRKLIQFLYFAAILPALITLITPEVFYSFPHFRFMKFFLHHMALVWTGIFLLLMTTTPITIRVLGQMFFLLNGYAAIIFFLNGQIGTNYLFLASTPDVTTPLDMLGDGVWYYIHLELFCFGLFVFMYFLYKAVSAIHSKKSSHTDAILNET